MSKVTLDFLQKIVSSTDPDVVVTKFQDAHGSGRGDNYTAMLYRIKLEGYKLNKEKNTKTHWERTLIYKCLPENYARREAFKSDSLFKNEVAFYTTVAPELLNYQKSKGCKVKKPFQSLPFCYYARSDILVLEDMCLQGFRMGDRKQGLNYEQCLAVLTELAKFHALTLAYKVEKPNEFKGLLENKECIKESYFIKENEEWYRSYYTAVRHNALAMVRDALCQNKNGCKYIEKFSKFLDDSFYFRMMDLVKPVEPLAVFCHGDCWTNNILFSTASGKIDKVCFVDFQLCRYSSPALDLANLIYCCTSRQLRDSKLESLFSEYFEALYSFLLELLDEELILCSQFLQKDQFRLLVQSDFNRCSLFGLGLALDMIPISTCDSEQAPDLYEEGENSQFDKIGVCPVWTSNESCKRNMMNLVCELVDRGAL